MAVDDRSVGHVGTSSASTQTRSSNLVLLILCMAQFMLVLDVAIVNVALPQIQRDLSFSSQSLQLVVTMYALTFGGLLLLGGRAADVLGRRRVFLAGLIVFTLGSLICGTARSAALMVAARALQGVGGALVSPAALSLLTTTFPEGEPRNRALGVWSALAAGGGAAGLILGGILTSTVGWRWVFLVNVPVGAAVMLAAGRVLPKDRQAHAAGRSAAEIDLLGAASITLALMAFVFGLSRGGQSSFDDPLVITLLLASGGLFIVFIQIERRVAAPLMPFNLFRLHNLTGANGATLLLSAVVLGTNYFLTLDFQQVLAYSPIQTGLAFVPLTLCAALASTVVARSVDRLGARTLLAAGMLTLACGSALLSRVAPHANYLVDTMPGMLLVAVGLGAGFTAGTLAATAGVATSQQGVASGILGTSQQLGGAIGLAILVSVSSAVMRSSTSTPPRSLTHGFDSAFLMCGAFALAAAAVVWLLVGADVGVSTGTGEQTRVVPAEALAGSNAYACTCLPALTQIRTTCAE